MKTMKISFFPRPVHVFFSLKCSPPHVHNESRNDQGPSHIPPRIRGFLARSGMLPRVFSTVQITETIPRKRENFYDTRWGGGEDTYKATFPVTFLKLTHRTRVKVEIKHPWNIYPASILSSLSLLPVDPLFSPPILFEFQPSKRITAGSRCYKGLVFKILFHIWPSWKKRQQEICCSRQSHFSQVNHSRSMRNRWIRIIPLIPGSVRCRRRSILFLLFFLFSVFNLEEENLIKCGGKFFPFFFSILFYSLVLFFFYRRKENFIRKINARWKIYFPLEESCNLSLASLICIHF